MTEREAIIALNLIPDIGSVRLKKLLEVFGSASKIFSGSRKFLESADKIGEKIAQGIRSFAFKNLKRELDSCEKLKIKIITLDDEDYPENLKEIYDPPLCLYVKGKILPADKHSIAIVGSRRASFYGLTNAQKFSADLSDKGFTIVSGMARGIDTYAHRGALDSGGRTIAVMGSGFNNIYPAENKKLSEEITHNGAVISEFGLDALPKRENFPRRNRVISGLSLGVLVVEAARNSGALITADFALEQGRDVFAIPGKLDSQTSCGTNGLIKQGAKLVTSADEVVEEFKPCIMEKQNVFTNKQDNPIAFLDNEEDSLYSLISDEAVSLDEIVEKSSKSIPEISTILLNLQMKRLVKQLPGKQFIKA